MITDDLLAAAQGVLPDVVEVVGTGRELGRAS